MAEMLVYYIFRRVGAARQERGRRMNFDGFGQRRAESAAAGELPAGQNLPLLPALRRGRLRAKDACASHGGGAGMQGRNKSRLRRLPCVPEGSVRAAPGRDYRRRYGAQECCGRYHPAGEKRRVHPPERGKKEGLYSPARAGSGRAVAECAVENSRRAAGLRGIPASHDERRKLLPTIRSRAVQPAALTAHTR